MDIKKDIKTKLLEFQQFSLKCCENSLQEEKIKKIVETLSIMVDNGREEEALVLIIELIERKKPQN